MCVLCAQKYVYHSEDGVRDIARRELVAPAADGNVVRLFCGLEREVTEELFGLATFLRAYSQVDQAGPRLHDYASEIDEWTCCAQFGGGGGPYDRLPI